MISNPSSSGEPGSRTYDVFLSLHLHGVQSVLDEVHAAGTHGVRGATVAVHDNAMDRIVFRDLCCRHGCDQSFEGTAIGASA